MSARPFQLVATAHVTAWTSDSPDRHRFVAECLARHLRGDWGDLDPHDWALNDRALACTAGRLLSAYPVPTDMAPVDARLWIITDDLDDPDTVTTILWPSDY